MAIVVFVLLLVTAACATAAVGPPATAVPSAPQVRQLVGANGADSSPTLRLADLTFLTGGEGWALATEPCDRPPCTVVARTQDGGRTWHRIAAPGAYLWEEDSCATKQRRLSPCVENLRFASPQVGYAFGPELFTTRNGGQSWRQEGGPTTLALATAGGHVIRVIQGAGVDVDQVQRQAIETPGAWQTLPLEVAGGMGPLLTDGATIFLVPNVAVGQAIYRSLDGGDTWARLPSPCDAGGTNIADAAMTPGGHLAVLCFSYPATAYVKTSADNGATFGVDHAVPLPSPYANIQHIAAASADVLAVSDDADNIQVSMDGGSTWHLVLRADASGGSQRQVALTYQDARTAHVIQPPKDLR
jgi:photosystem II stability/assembly factor-like uncharacterized protein